MSYLLKWANLFHGNLKYNHLLIVDSFSSSTKVSLSFLSSFFQNFSFLANRFIPFFLFFSLDNRLWWNFLNGLVGILSVSGKLEEYESVTNINDSSSNVEISCCSSKFIVDVFFMLCCILYWTIFEINPNIYDLPGVWVMSRLITLSIFKSASFTSSFWSNFRVLQLLACSITFVCPSLNILKALILFMFQY